MTSLDLFLGRQGRFLNEAPCGQVPLVGDLALVVDEKLRLDQIRESVSVSAGAALKELRVFDVYRGSGVEPGRKSVALGLILQETSRTLTDGDADAVVAAVVARLEQDHNATIRD